MSRGATDGTFDECNQGADITGVEAHSFVSNKIFDNEQIALSTREVNEANVSITFFKKYTEVSTTQRL